MKQIQHVVVLMLENRSFDHMLGFYQHPDTTFKGLTGTETNPRGSGPDVKVTSTATGKIAFDPHHKHQNVRIQLTGKNVPLTAANVTMKGFVVDAESIDAANAGMVMDCFDPKALPVLSALVREYAVADQWFCSVPGQTWPNRNFAHAATSDDRVNNRPYKLFGNKTIFEQLEPAGATWRVYHDGFPEVMAFWRLADGNRPANFQDMGDFRKAVAANALPNYAFIEPQHFFKGSNSQHPGNNEKSNRDMLAGERLIWSVWDTLVSNKKVWEKTLLVITWDEHGGFHDHEKPKKTVAPKEGDIEYGFPFDLTGVRVPAVLVSPWIRRGVVDHTIYDHASIPKSVRLRFAPGAKHLTQRDRDANSWWAADIWEANARQDVPNIPEPELPASPAGLTEDEDDFAPLLEDEEDLAWLVTAVDKLLEQKADGIPVEVAAHTAQVAATAAERVTTRGDLERYSREVADKLR